jgi:hypothetical protein
MWIEKATVLHKCLRFVSQNVRCSIRNPTLRLARYMQTEARLVYALQIKPIENDGISAKSAKGSPH